MRVSILRRLERCNNVFNFHALAKIRVDIVSQNFPILADDERRWDRHKPRRAVLVLLKAQAMRKIERAHLLTEPDREAKGQRVTVIDIR